MLPRESHLIQNITFILLGISYLVWLISLSASSVLKYIILGIIHASFIFILMRFIMQRLKRKKVSAKINFIITMVASFVLSFALMGAMIFVVISGLENGFINYSNAAGTYEYEGTIFKYYNDKLPLYVEDLVHDLNGVEHEEYSCRWTVDESPFLAQMEARQRPRFDADGYESIPDLEYTITKIKVPFLYTMCKKTLIQNQEEFYAEYPDGYQKVYEEEDPTPWGAKETYRLCSQDSGPSDCYLLCYEHCIVEINFLDWEPTTEQMAIVCEKLSGM